MKINSINSLLAPSFYNVKNKNMQPLVQFRGTYTDVFEKSFQNPDENVPFGVDKSLLKKSKFHLRYKLQNCSQDIVEAAKETAKLTKTFKKALDKEYGKENYVVVSIGTSPALIGKGLELMGTDVRYVPISGIRFLHPEECPPETVKKKMGKNYLKFLNSIGLNKDKVNKDDRKYILCDYTASGNSLKFAHYVATDVLGMDKDKIVSLSLNDFLKQYLKDQEDEKQLRVLYNYISNYLSCQNAEYYSDVPHVDCKELPNFDLSMARLMGMSHKTDKFDMALRCFL